MTDGDERLRAGITALAETVDPTRTPDDAVTDVRRRADDAPAGWSARRRSPLILAAAAVVVLALVAAVVVLRPRAVDDRITVDPGPAATAPAPTVPIPTTVPERTTTRSLPPAQGTWRDLPAGSAGPVSPRAMVWTGREVILWRGEDVQRREEFPPDRTYRYDPVAQRWSALPRDPLPATGIGGGIPGGAWTGREALFWAAEGVVAWNPATGRWRTAAAPPHAHDHRAVWTGTEAVFPLDALAYDPAANRWRTLAEPPAGLAASVNGDANSLLMVDGKIVVVGERSGFYDVATDTWRDTGPVVPDQPGALSGGWDGWTASVFPVDGRPIAVDGQLTTARLLDLETGQWRDAPDLVPPVAPSEGSPAFAVLDGGGLVVSHAGQTAYRPPGSPWTQATEPGAGAGAGPGPGPMVAAGDRVYAYQGWAPDGPHFAVFTP
jgi:hypothetical protein